jgi:hypothetical protein
MKNTLAENMLRFAPKNLGAKDIKILKRLAEQQTPQSTSLQYVPAYNTGGILTANSEYIAAPFTNGTTYWLKSNQSAAQRITTTQKLVAGFGIQENTNGSPMKKLFNGNCIFVTDLFFSATKTDPVTGKQIENPSGATDTQSAGNEKGDKKYVGNVCFIKTNVIVQEQLNSISTMLKAIPINITNEDVIKGVAKLIISLVEMGVKYNDFSQKSEELTNAKTNGKFTTLQLR